MLKRAKIFWHSLLMAMNELRVNKIRTFLSLLGITIGIFCIIGVLATVNSLENNIQAEIKSLGTNTIYIDKWDYSAGGGPDYPWWKYVKRPSPKFEEMEEIKKRTVTAEHTAFVINTSGSVEVDDNILNNVILYGVSEEFSLIQPIEIKYGRYLIDVEFGIGTHTCVIGNEIAEKTFWRSKKGPWETVDH